MRPVRSHYQAHHEGNTPLSTLAIVTLHSDTKVTLNDVASGTSARYAQPRGCAVHGLPPSAFRERCHRGARRLVTVRRVPSDPAKWNCWRWGLGERRGQHPTALPRLLGWPIMLPERMRARRAPSSGEAGGTTIVATHDPVVAGPNAGTRITTRHVNPTPPAAFALNSAKASTVLLCCCGARVRKRYNREKADGRQITHCICPSLTAYVICSVQTGKQRRARHAMRALSMQSDGLRLL